MKIVLSFCFDVVNWKYLLHKTKQKLQIHFGGTRMEANKQIVIIDNLKKKKKTKIKMMKKTSWLCKPHYYLWQRKIKRKKRKEKEENVSRIHINDLQLGEFTSQSVHVHLAVMHLILSVYFVFIRQFKNRQTDISYRILSIQEENKRGRKREKKIMKREEKRKVKFNEIQTE